MMMISQNICVKGAEARTHLLTKLRLKLVSKYRQMRRSFTVLWRFCIVDDSYLARG